MKKITFWIIALINLLFIMVANGQENALVSGSIDFLKQEKVFNVDFYYESMAIGVYRNEAGYIQKKVTELNNSKPGQGDEWLVKWNQKKITLFEPNFLKALNKKLKKAGITAEKGSANSKYTIIINPYYLEEGWDVVINSLPALVRMQILVCETADNSKQVAEFRITGETNTGGQVYGGALAFDEAGKTFGRLLMKLMK